MEPQHTAGPLLTSEIHEQLLAAARNAVSRVSCSLDLQRSTSSIEIQADGWLSQGRHYPYLSECRERTIYYWAGQAFQPVARYTNALIKLVPTQWGAPTFEIDGVKMLPTAILSPYEDARRKVELIRPKGRTILDTCGGLGYFASWCLKGGAVQIQSFEKNADVLWLRTLNPWSPPAGGSLHLAHADVALEIEAQPDHSFDAVLHDPPRFALAGELYSQVFYDHLARVLKPRGVLFHYTGSPNKLTSGRDVPAEVSARLRKAGFATVLHGDGVLARRR